MKKKSVVIIGGGISGLAAALRLLEKKGETAGDLGITVLEAQDRFGGVIETVRRDGFLLEGGPDSFISEKPWALDLCRRLGLGDRVIGTREDNRRSFILKKDRLIPVPEGFYLIAPSRILPWAFSPLIGWRGKVRMACDLFIPPARGTGDESVGSFIRRRLGREALERVGQPMIAGIYSADPDRLSLAATFPRFRDMERNYGSLIRAFRAARRERIAKAADNHGIESRTSGPRYGIFLSLDGGIGTIAGALCEKLSSRITMRTRARVEGLSYRGCWKIRLGGGKDLESDAVCLAVPAHEASRLLAGAAPGLSGGLAAIDYESVATVNLGFRAGDVRRALDGFGFVVPAAEKRNLSACTFSSVKYPGRAPDGFVLLRAFLGGAFHPGLVEQSDDVLVRTVLEELNRAVGLRGDPVLVSLRRYVSSMPQYRPGHLDRVAGIEALTAQMPGLFLAGNGFRGLGIPDCVRSGEAAADRIAEWLGGFAAGVPVWVP